MAPRHGAAGEDGFFANMCLDVAIAPVLHKTCESIKSPRKKLLATRQKNHSVESKKCSLARVYVARGSCSGGFYCMIFSGNPNFSPQNFKLKFSNQNSASFIFSPIRFSYSTLPPASPWTSSRACCAGCVDCLTQRGRPGLALLFSSCPLTDATFHSCALSHQVNALPGGEALDTLAELANGYLLFEWAHMTYV